MAEISSARKHDFLEKTKKDSQDRRRNILHLILNYLMDHGLERTADVLFDEAHMGEQYQVCENIDLDIILQEYQSYYLTKFQKSPKILRKIMDSNDNKNKEKKHSRKKSASNLTKKRAMKIESNEKCSESDFQFEIVSLSPENKIRSAKDLLDTYDLSLYINETYTGELKEFAEAISKEIIPETSTQFSDCIGLDSAIECLKEAVIYPMLYPQLFHNIDEYWNGILLFGPPGNGKTLLAKALATETKSTLINLTNSTFISKWRGESEKMLKVLFNMAQYYAPSVIFIDEIDAMTFEGNHEASRRFKSELLVQIDGILKLSAPVLILATTNHPWALDKAILRRFEKRILVNIPNEENRPKLMEYYLKKYNGMLTKDEMVSVSKELKRFSGHDIKTVVKEASMCLIREKIKERKENDQSKTNIKHIKMALGKIRPCITETECSKYEEWSKEFGSS